MIIWILVYSVYSNPDLLKVLYFNTSSDLEDFVQENKINVCPRLIETLKLSLELDLNCRGSI